MFPTASVIVKIPMTCEKGLPPCLMIYGTNVSWGGGGGGGPSLRSVLASVCVCTRYSDLEWGYISAHFEKTS